MLRAGGVTHNPVPHLGSWHTWRYKRCFMNDALVHKLKPLIERFLWSHNAAALRSYSFFDFDLNPKVSLPSSAVITVLQTATLVTKWRSALPPLESACGQRDMMSYKVNNSLFNSSNVFKLHILLVQRKVLLHLLTAEYFFHLSPDVSEL